MKLETCLSLSYSFDRLIVWCKVVPDGVDAVKRIRTYDISVVYDVHYSTPRVWLFGYDDTKNPLTGNEWQSDFSPDHLHKTVTYEAHPHLGFSSPSIHPCKHASAMLKMISLAVGDSGAQLDVKLYLLIFLKFIQSIIPNIEYDYTSEFEVRVDPDESPAKSPLFFH